MIDEIKRETNQRMGKSLEALGHAFGRIRTGRANPAILEGIQVLLLRHRYAAESGGVDQRRGCAHAGDLAVGQEAASRHREGDSQERPRHHTRSRPPRSIRIPLPPLSEENRRDLARHAKQEAEQGRVAIRNIRRDAIGEIRELVKEKEISEDDARRAEEDIQKLTDKRISEIDHALSEKEADLLKI